MSFILERRAVVKTSIRIDVTDIEKLRRDLNDYGFAELIEGIETEDDLIQLLEEDPDTLAQVFHVMMNSSGYGVPDESFMDGENYQVVLD